MTSASAKGKGAVPSIRLFGHSGAPQWPPVSTPFNAAITVAMVRTATA
jgi:hypothetical protein